jgi:hypothetical protein
VSSGHKGEAQGFAPLGSEQTIGGNLRSDFALRSDFSLFHQLLELAIAYLILAGLILIFTSLMILLTTAILLKNYL